MSLWADVYYLPCYDRVTAHHCGCSTIRLGPLPPTYFGAGWGCRGASSIKIFLSLSFTLFSLSFQSTESISCTHTRTTHFFSLPSVYSAASDHLDLTCIVKNGAALPLSSSLSFTPFPIQLSVINVQVLQYMNRGREESKEWGMNWWMGG